MPLLCSTNAACLQGRRRPQQYQHVELNILSIQFLCAASLTIASEILCDMLTCVTELQTCATAKDQAVQLLLDVHCLC